MSVELEDDSGRLWPMTYRCVPHRYSYELRAGWKVSHTPFTRGLSTVAVVLAHTGMSPDHAIPPPIFHEVFLYMFCLSLRALAELSTRRAGRSNC